MKESFSFRKTPTSKYTKNDGMRKITSLQPWNKWWTQAAIINECKIVIRDCWGTLKSWHDCSSLESFKMEQPLYASHKRHTRYHVWNVLMWKVKRKSETNCSRCLWCTRLIPLASSDLRGSSAGIAPTHCIQASASRKAFSQRKRGASAKFERYFLSFPLNGVPLSIADTLKTQLFLLSCFTLCVRPCEVTSQILLAWVLGFLSQALLSEKL